MHLLRTQFQNGIVAEFLPPKKESHDVIILCDGLPTLPAKKKLIRFLSKKNFWVFHIRYTGTWESDGEFLSHSPEEDIWGVIESLTKPFASIWDGVEYKVEARRIFVIGSSFGGTAALMSSLSEKVYKIVALCPPIDWTYQEDTESLDYLKNIIRQGYGGGYRFSDENWKKLESGTFFNPVNHTKEFDPQKILIMHAQDDEVVSYEPVKKFAHDIGCVFISRKFQF